MGTERLQGYDIGNITDAIKEGARDAASALIESANTAEQQGKKSLNAVGKEAKKLNNILEDLNETMNILFSSRKGKNKGVFDNTDEKLAQKTIENIKDQTLANQQLAQLQKSISTSKVKYYTDEINALKHVTQAYNKYNDAVKKRLSETTIKDRKNDVLRWGHAYQALLPEGAENQLSSIGDGFTDFWNKIKDEVKSATGGLRAYSTEAFKDTFSLMKQMESNGFDFELFKPAQINNVENFSTVVDRSTKSLKKMTDIDIKQSGSEMTDFFIEIEKEAKKMNESWADGVLKFKELLKLYPKLKYYQTHGGSNKHTLRFLDDINTLEIPFLSNAKQKKLQSEADSFELPEHLQKINAEKEKQIQLDKQIQEENEKTAVSVEKVTEKLEEQNVSLKQNIDYGLLKRRIQQSQKSVYEDNNYSWIGYYNNQQEAIAENLADNKQLLHSELNALLTEDKNFLHSLEEESNQLKTSLTSVQDMVMRISKNSSITYLDKNKGDENWYKGYAEAYKQIDDRLGELNAKYKLANEELEEYITLQVKAEKIMSKMRTHNGGVQASGAQNAHELNQWILKSFANDLNIDPDEIYSGLFGNIVDALYGGKNFSLFDDDGKKKNLRYIAANILGQDEFSTEEDARKLQDINYILNYIKTNLTEISETDFSRFIEQTRSELGFAKQMIDDGVNIDHYSKQYKEKEGLLNKLLILQEQFHKSSIDNTITQEQIQEEEHLSDVVEESAERQKRAKEKTEIVTKQTSDTAKESVQEQINAEKHLDDVVEESAKRQQEVAEKIIDADKRQIKSKEELYRATLKQKSIAALETSIANTEKYLSQKGIVGNEEGWSVVQSLGFAQTQQIHNAYNAETGVLETNADKIVTNYEKLKNAIIATDKAVQNLEHDLKLIQEKTPSVDTSYLQENITSVKKHLEALKEERDSYAKSSDYQETYIQHNKEIQEAHDAFANSLRQKDAISEYTANQQRLVDIYKELTILEDRRFKLNQGLIVESSKTPDADKKELLDIERKSLALIQEKINIEKNYTGNVLKEEIAFSEKRTKNEERLIELKKHASEKSQQQSIKEVNKLYEDLNAKLLRRYELEKRIKTNTSESYDSTKDLNALQKINKEIEDLQQKRLSLGSKDNTTKAKETDINDLELRKKLLNEIVLAYGKANDELRNLEAKSNTPGSTKVYDPILESKREQVAKLKEEAEKAVESMLKLYSKGDASNPEYVNLYNTYQSGTANSKAADQAKSQEQFNANKQAALDEKEALDLLKQSLENLSKSYGQLASSAKYGIDSLLFQTNYDNLNDALQKVQKYTDKALKAGVSDSKIGIYKSDYFSQISSSVQQGGISSVEKYLSEIEKVENKLRDSGQITEEAKQNFNGLKEVFVNLIKDTDFSDANQWQNFIVSLASLGTGLQSELDKISKQSKLTWINDQIQALDKLSYKSDDVKSKLTELKAKVAAYESAKQSGDKELINKAERDLLEQAPGLIAKIQQLASGKGNLIEESIGKVSNINDLNRALLEYAKNQKYTQALGTSLKSSNGEVTGTFIDQNGAVVKLTASMDQMKNAMKVVTTTQRGAVGLFGSFKNALHSATQSLAFYFSGTALIRKFFSEFRQGIDVLKKYDSALTNISYTMNMSKDSLQDLGSSAVEMAKDLSMSLENTMKIYQIYANMQTTAEEIAETARPTAILSNLSGVDSSTASDQIQGILNQFSMLKDAEVDVAETSMHVVDVLDKISANVAIDYAKGIGIISDAVTATGQAAYDAGMSYEQLAAVSAKVAERTREDGSSIGNAIKTILTRISKVGKMPGYADEVDNETLSQASASLNEIGIAVYNADGSFRSIDIILGELAKKWDGLTDAQQANIAYNVAATRQSNKFRAILEAWTSATELATEATNTLGNAEANQEKYLESYNGKLQQIKTQLDAFWLALFNSDAISSVLDFIIKLTKGFNSLAETITPLGAFLVGFTGILTAMTAGKYIKGKGFLNFIQNFGRAKMFVLYKYAEINKCSLGY